MGNTNEKLTIRELEILSLISKGLKTRDIAEKLYISPRTVNTHKTHLCMKLRFKSTVELTCYSINYKETLDKRIHG